MLAASPLAIGPRPDLVGLRLSLNTPVVAEPDLPVGPARAALALTRVEGGLQVLLALRSVRTGRVVVLAPEQDAPRLDDAEAGLAEAERMGFLFDRDLASDAGADLLSHWEEFVSDSAPEPAEDEVLTKFRSRESTSDAGDELRAQEIRLRLLGRF